MAAVLLPDEAILRCMDCSSRFSVVNRKHHCRACGNVYCGKCCGDYEMMKGCGPQPVRVCRKCKTTKFSKPSKPSSIFDSSSAASSNGDFVNIFDLPDNDITGVGNPPKKHQPVPPPSSSLFSSSPPSSSIFDDGLLLPNINDPLSSPSLSFSSSTLPSPALSASSASSISQSLPLRNSSSLFTAPPTLSTDVILPNIFDTESDESSLLSSVTDSSRSDKGMKDKAAPPLGKPTFTKYSPPSLPSSPSPPPLSLPSLEDDDSLLSLPHLPSLTSDDSWTTPPTLPPLTHSTKSSSAAEIERVVQLERLLKEKEKQLISWKEQETANHKQFENLLQHVERNLLATTERAVAAERDAAILRQRLDELSTLQVSTEKERITWQQRAEASEKELESLKDSLSHFSHSFSAGDMQDRLDSYENLIGGVQDTSALITSQIQTIQNDLSASMRQMSQHQMTFRNILLLLKNIHCFGPDGSLPDSTPAPSSSSSS